MLIYIFNPEARHVNRSSIDVSAPPDLRLITGWHYSVISAQSCETTFPLPYLGNGGNWSCAAIPNASIRLRKHGLLSMDCSYLRKVLSVRNYAPQAVFSTPRVLSDLYVSRIMTVGSHTPIVKGGLHRKIPNIAYVFKWMTKLNCSESWRISSIKCLILESFVVNQTTCKLKPICVGTW